MPVIFKKRSRSFLEGLMLKSHVASINQMVVYQGKVKGNEKLGLLFVICHLLGSNAILSYCKLDFFTIDVPFLG